MALRIQTKQVIDCDDWDALVEHTYNRPYSFQQQDGCKSRGSESITIPEECEDYENDTVPEKINGGEMGVSFKAWLERDPKAWTGTEGDRNCLHLFWKRNFYPSVQMVANDLHTKGLVPAGEYIINIDW